MTVDLREALAPDVLDLLQECVFLRDLDGRVLYWNKAAARLYGWTAQQALGRNQHELLKTRQYQPLTSFEDTLRREGHWHGKLMRNTASGAELVVHARWALRRNAAGEPVAILDASRDITARARSSLTSMDRERRYRNLFESPAAAFLELDFSDVGTLVTEMRRSGVTDLDRQLRERPEIVREMMRLARVLEANDQAIERFGARRKQDLLGPSEVFWPSDSTQVFADSIVAGLARQSNFVRETKLRTIQGVEFDAEFAVHFDPENTSTGLVTVGVVDISERNRARAAFEHAEFMYRNLFHGTALPFVRLDSTRLTRMFQDLRAAGVTDLDEYISAHPEFLKAGMDASILVEANALAAKLHGARSPEELYGPMTRFWGPGGTAVIRKSFVTGFAGAPGCQGEARIRRLDGSEVDVMSLIIATPEMREKGIVLVGHIDITEQVAARAALESMQADLAHAARVSVLGELTASIAHEVNQPLTAIMTNAEAGLRWLRRDEPDVEEVQTLMTRVVADARRAADIIQRIRGLATRKEAVREAVSLNGVIEEAALFMRHEMQTHDVELALELNADVPDILADRVQMQQVVVNLAVNAIQAMASGGANKRCLRIASRAADAGHAQVEVDDSGPGIAPEHAPHLFERFFSTKKSGMGMGLAICQSIIEAHGGRIEATNHSEGGARFSFVLPVARDT